MKVASWKLLALLILVLSPALSVACILCSSQGMPLAKEITDAKLVVFGKITDSRLGPDGIRGTSEFQVETVLRGDRDSFKQGKITLPRYVPVVPGVKYLIFLDVSQGQFDPYRNIVCSSDRLVGYLQKMPALTGLGTPDQRQARLKYVFDYLQDGEPELAADAYKEWSVATNQDVAAVAGQLSAEKLRHWLLDAKTPTHCLSLYAYLLGASGQASDAVLLTKLATNPPDSRFSTSLDGILAGMVRQQPGDAWKQVQSIIVDKSRSFSERHAILRFLRFQWEIDRAASKAQIIACLDQLIDQPDTMDLAINLLREWKCWDHQVKVLNLFTTMPTLAPITRRAIIRYALDCPGEASRQFISAARAKDAELVRDVQETIDLIEKR